MRGFFKGFFYTAGSIAIAAGLAVVSVMGLALAQDEIIEDVAAAWITASVMFAVFGAILIVIAVLLERTQDADTDHDQR